MKVWKLYAGDELVADLVVTGLDDPWLLARVEPGPGFERYRPLFEFDLAEAGDDGEDEDDDEEPVDPRVLEMRRALRLRTPKGDAVTAFLLHVDGDEAWWRWVD